MNKSRKIAIAHKICRDFIDGYNTIYDVRQNGEMTTECVVCLPLCYRDYDGVGLYVECQDDGSIYISDYGDIAFHQDLNETQVKNICKMHKDLMYQPGSLEICARCEEEKAADVIFSFVHAIVDSFDMKG